MGTGKTMGLGAALALLAAAARAEPPASTPVGDLSHDGAVGACEPIAHVRGLKAGGDGFLAVRAGPGAGYALLDRLGNGRHLRLCHSQGRWVSVLYAPPDAPADCPADSPDIRRYRGPCKAGWVHWDWVYIIAG